MEETEDDVSLNVLLINFNLNSTSFLFMLYVWLFQFYWWCQLLLQLAELIKKGSVQVGDVSQVLCQKYKQALQSDEVILNLKPVI